jgi:polynucleotide 5'-kinase involved in rRNA processing
LTRTKSSAARKKNRTERFKAYFADSQLQKISFEKIRGARTSFFNGRIANQKELEILCRLTETDVTYAEWGHRSISLIARRKLTQDATKSLKNYLSLSSVSTETPAYFRQRLVGMVDSAGDTSGIGIIEVVDFQNKELHIRCNSGIASKIKVLQFSDYRYNETQ